MKELAERKYLEFVHRVQHHLKSLLFQRNRLKYFQKKKRALARRITVRVWEYLDRIYERIGRPLPPKLLKVAEANEQAVKRYVPTFYPGEITLFLASDLRIAASAYAPLEWRNLAAHVNLEKMPGDHVSIIEEPNVRVLAGRLKEIMAANTGTALGFILAFLLF
jgi:thioesterase domain-containing protein